MATEPLSCTLENDDTVLVGGDLRISFRRTIRVPDNHQESFLPPDLGAFPLKRVSQYADKLPPRMSANGGLLFPMYRRCTDHHTKDLVAYLVKNQKRCG